MRMGHLVRLVDCSGVSGCGDNIAEVAMFRDGEVALHWLTKTPCTAVFRSVADLLAVHGHQGCTYIQWDDGQEPERSS